MVIKDIKNKISKDVNQSFKEWIHTALDNGAGAAHRWCSQTPKAPPLPDQVKDDHGELDERLREPRFQQGHMLAMFWETCGPWMAMRAKHDALALHTPLFCLQAADQSTPRMDKKDAAKLLNHYNPHDTGGMHGMFQVHLGMKVRLTDSLCKELGLVKDAEGVVVHISAHPDDEEMVRRGIKEAEDGHEVRLYLTQMPLGLWLRMDKYEDTPQALQLSQSTNLEVADTQSLLFVEPRTPLMPFTWREFKVYRCGFPLTHAMVRTSTACQGKTCELGVVIDCAKRESGANATKPEDYWLHMYVMLSRATSLQDLLLIRAPDATFLLQGPPRELKQRLQMFRSRVAKCSKHALSIASKLGFQTFLR